MDETEVYRNSMSFAVGNREKDLWRASYRANRACAEFIQKTLAENFDGIHLSDGCLQTILEAYGFNRVMWVLANTVGKGNADGRYSQSNKEWAKTFRIPPDTHNSEFCVTSHPVIVNELVDAVRKAWDDLHLWKREQMESHLGQNLIGHVLVIDPFTLKDSYKTPENQLFLALSGNGCNPQALGRKVFGAFLNDGEKSFLYTKPLFAIPANRFLFYPGHVEQRDFCDALSISLAEYALIDHPERGVCLYHCGNARYLLQVQAPDFQAKLFGDAGGR